MTRPHSDTLHWDQAHEAAADYAEAQGLELRGYALRDLAHEVACDPGHPAWGPYWANEQPAPKPDLHPIFALALAPYAPPANDTRESA